MIPKEVQKKKDKIKNYLEGLGIDIEQVDDEKKLLTAFIHKSFAADFTQDVPFNERLEFLWDAILDAIIAKKLFTNYDLPESKLTLHKVSLVKKENLAKIGKNIMLHQMIFLGKGEKNSGWREKKAIIEDALEALIGYIYIDLWIKEVEQFVEKYIYSSLDREKQELMWGKSPKSVLQEAVQKKYKKLPKYKDYDYKKDSTGEVIKYKSEVYIQGEKKWTGFGKNKKIAQKKAAKNAFQNFDNIKKEFSDIW